MYNLTHFPVTLACRFRQVTLYVTIFCMSQSHTRTWISNIMSICLFLCSVSQGERWLFILLILVKFFNILHFRIWDKVVGGSFAVLVHVAVAIFMTFKRPLLSMNSKDAMLKYLSKVSQVNLQMWWKKFNRSLWRFSYPELDTTLCDNVCLWLATGQRFSLGPPISSTNKTDHHDITEILLKVALNTINHPNHLLVI